MMMTTTISMMMKLLLLLLAVTPFIAAVALSPRYHYCQFTARLTIVPVVPWEAPSTPEGPPDQLPKFYHAVLTFERLNVCSVGLNVTTTTKKRSSTIGRKKSSPREKNPGYAYEKRARRLTLVWGPQMVNPARHQLTMRSSPCT